jgi:hypothetical protein
MYNTLCSHSILMFLCPIWSINYTIKKEVPDLTSFTSPRLFPTHLPYPLLPISAKNSTYKIVYLCRNPKDTFVSLWHFSNLNSVTPTSIGSLSLEDASDMFCRGVIKHIWAVLGSCLGYWKESLEKPQNVLFLKFEEMKAHPIANLRRLAEFLGNPFSPEEEAKGVVNDISRLCSFDNLSNLEVNKNGKSFFGRENNVFFRRGQVGDWMSSLTTEMIDKFDCITEEKFNGIGIAF